MHYLLCQHNFPAQHGAMCGSPGTGICQDIELIYVMVCLRSMHPKISQFPNAEIYDCLVSNGDNVCAPDYGARVYGLMVRANHLPSKTCLPVVNCALWCFCLAGGCTVCHAGL